MVTTYVIESETLGQKVFCNEFDNGQVSVRTEDNVPYSQFELAIANMCDAKIVKEIHVLKKLFEGTLTETKTI